MCWAININDMFSFLIFQCLTHSQYILLVSRQSIFSFSLSSQSGYCKQLHKQQNSDALIKPIPMSRFLYRPTTKISFCVSLYPQGGGRVILFYNTALNTAGQQKKVLIAPHTV